MESNDTSTRDLHRQYRSELLRFAGHLLGTTREIVAHAETLWNWANAPGSDLHARLSALRHADNHRPMKRDDDPKALIDEADVYYRFIVDTPKVTTE
jgi:hypothetical protein